VARVTDKAVRSIGGIERFVERHRRRDPGFRLWARSISRQRDMAGKSWSAWSGLSNGKRMLFLAQDDPARVTPGTGNDQGVRLPSPEDRTFIGIQVHPGLLPAGVKPDGEAGAVRDHNSVSRNGPGIS